MVIRFLVQPFRRLPIFYAGCGLPEASVSLPSQGTAPCCLRSSGFTSRPCPPILSCVTFLGPSGSPRQSAFCVLQRGIYLWSFGSPNHRRSSLFLRLHFALCRRRRCFCWPSLRPNELGSYRLCHLWLPLSVMMPVFLMFLSLWPSRSRSPVPSLAPSW